MSFFWTMNFPIPEMHTVRPGLAAYRIREFRGMWSAKHEDQRAVLARVPDVRGNCALQQVRCGAISR
jgi:hypothetical protein